MVFKKILSIVFNNYLLKKVSWAPNKHIRMISKGSCDTEDWSDGCWKSSFAINEYITFKN